MANAQKVTCTARSPLLPLFSFVLFFGAAFFFVLSSGIADNSILNALRCYAVCLLPLMYGIMLLLEYKNTELTVSEDGITYTNRLGRVESFDWKQVRKRSQFFRGWSILIRFTEKRNWMGGYKTVWIGSHYKNYWELNDWLDAHGKLNKE